MRRTIAITAAPCLVLSKPHSSNVRGIMSVRDLKLFSLLLIGPLGAYAAYHLVFVVRYISAESYPLLHERMQMPFVLLDFAGLALVLLVTMTWVLKHRTGLDAFKPSRNALPPLALALAVLGVAALILLSIYRVLGTLNPQEVLSGYIDYQFQATNGGAWMILGCYAALYLLLMDMYYGGVRAANGATFLTALLITSVSGGRGILMLFAVTFLLLLLLQNVRWRDFIGTSVVTVLIMAASFIVVTDLRAPTTGTSPVGKVPTNAQYEAPTESYEDLNYNAAFITEDVLRGLTSGQVTPKPYALWDALVHLVPRPLMPEKPISTAETVALYPHVAERGTNITFPLKANLMMHLGPWAFWLDWLVVAAAQIVFMAGAAQRASKPALWSFAAIFMGCAFTLISRGGLLNARLLDQVVIFLVAYVGYRVALTVFDAQRSPSMVRQPTMPG